MFQKISNPLWCIVLRVQGNENRNQGEHLRGLVLGDVFEGGCKLEHKCWADIGATSKSEVHHIVCAQQIFVSDYIPVEIIQLPVSSKGSIVSSLNKLLFLFLRFLEESCYPISCGNSSHPQSNQPLQTNPFGLLLRFGILQAVHHLLLYFLDCLFVGFLRRLAVAKPVA